VALIISAWDGGDGHYRKVTPLSVAFFAAFLHCWPEFKNWTPFALQWQFRC
jgi:hypothetical protein